MFPTPASVLSTAQAEGIKGQYYRKPLSLSLALLLPFKAFLPPPPSHSFTHHHSCPAPSCASPSELILSGSTNLEQKLVLLPPSPSSPKLGLQSPPSLLHIAVETQISRYPSYRARSLARYANLDPFPMHPPAAARRPRRREGRVGELAVAMCDVETNRRSDKSRGKN